jgi:bifunctional UDP-N-acetylglucosamine pyrophosphorylase/glucosamine-1-phosphate N-acetyltransferase
MMDQVAAIVLAAGKGKRINSTKTNKVTRKIADRPMISYTAKLIKQVGINNVLVVIGYARSSVKQVLGQSYQYVVQQPQLGTGHAVLTALPYLPRNCRHVLVLNGDDSAFYLPQDIQQLIRTHIDNQADMTLMTVVKKDPGQLGRIIRDQQGRVTAIVEFKNASNQQKQIKEINTAVYCFKRRFLETYLPQVKKNPLSQEYYLTDLLAIAVKNNQTVAAVSLANPARFHGVNTKQDLISANQKMSQRN